jgi:hypothetical protein
LALTPTDNQAFLREVDDDLRRDQMTGFVKRWGKIVGVTVVVALIALAALLYWQHRRAQQAAARGETFVSLLDDVAAGRATANDPRLGELSQADEVGYSSMARMTQANLAARTNAKAAAASFKAIADDTAVPQPVRDLAMLRATTLEFDRLPPAEVVARLKGLAQPGNPWFGSAAELTGLAYLKQNRKDLAGPLFAKIVADDKAPGALRGRAASMATALGQTLPAPTASAAVSQ